MLRPGEMIAFYRRQIGMTQDELADGICNVTTLSRYENGSRIPPQSTYVKIMEKLGVIGFSYEQFIMGADYECEKLKREILEDLSIHDVSRMDEKLWTYKKLKDKDSIQQEQFYQAAMLVWQKMYLDQSENLKEKLLEILCLSRDGIEEIFDKKVLWLSYEEKWVLNNLGLVYLEEKDLALATDIFFRLWQMMEKEQMDHYYGRKGKAVLLNNLALCLMEMGKPEKAMEYINKAMNLVIRDGGGAVVLSLIKTKAQIFGAMGDQDTKESIRLFIKEALGFAKIMQRSEEESMMILNSPLGISIL